MLDNQKARSMAAHVVEPVASLLLRLRIKPNQVTVFTAFATSIILLSTWPQGNFLIGALLAMPFVFGDLLDGTMARLSGENSRYGSFLDSVLDRVTDAAIFGSLIWYFANNQNSQMVATSTLALSSALLISYIRAKADAVSADAKVGIMERSERIAVIAVGVFTFSAGITWALEVAVAVIAILNVVTVYQRMLSVKRSIDVDS